MIIPMDDTNHLTRTERAAPSVQSLHAAPRDDDTLFNQGEMHARAMSRATPPEAPRQMPEQQIRYWRMGAIARACADLFLRQFR
jgi:hypothetical protein